jgi:hypothetical protein
MELRQEKKSAEPDFGLLMFQRPLMMVSMFSLCQIRTNTGMNGVVPAWRLASLIEASPWAENMKLQAKSEAEKRAARGVTTVIDGALENPQHR